MQKDYIFIKIIILFIIPNINIIKGGARIKQNNFALKSNNYIT